MTRPVARGCLVSRYSNFSKSAHLLLGKKNTWDDSRLTGTILTHQLVSTVGECLSPLFWFVIIVFFFSLSISVSLQKDYYFKHIFEERGNSFHFFLGGGEVESSLF